METTIHFADSTDGVLVHEPHQPVVVDAARESLFSFLQTKGQVAGTGDMILPPGTRYLESRGNMILALYEFAPRIWTFKSTFDCDALGGWSNVAKPVTLTAALPYVLLLVPFIKSSLGFYAYVGANQCVLLKQPLTSLQDQTFIAPLLNCMDHFRFGKFWLCTGRGLEVELEHWVGRDHYKKFFIGGHPMTQRYIPMVLSLVARGFSGRAFNADLSPGGTYYYKHKNTDIYPFCSWEKSSKADPQFWEKMAWRATNYTVQNVMNDVYGIVRKYHGGNNCDEGLTAYTMAKRYINTCGQHLTGGQNV